MGKYVEPPEQQPCRWCGLPCIRNEVHPVYGYPDWHDDCIMKAASAMVWLAENRFSGEREIAWILKFNEYKGVQEED